MIFDLRPCLTIPDGPYQWFLPTSCMAVQADYSHVPGLHPVKASASMILSPDEILSWKSILTLLFKTLFDMYYHSPPTLQFFFLINSFQPIKLCSVLLFFIISYDQALSNSFHVFLTLDSSLSGTIVTLPYIWIFLGQFLSIYPLIFKISLHSSLPNWSLHIFWYFAILLFFFSCKMFYSRNPFFLSLFYLKLHLEFLSMNWSGISATVLKNTSCPLMLHLAFLLFNFRSSFKS